MSHTLRGTKRGRRSSESSSNSVRESGSQLRSFPGSLEHISKAERIMLAGTAEIFGLTPERLFALAVAESNLHRDLEADQRPFSFEQSQPPVETTSGIVGDAFGSYAPSWLESLPLAGSHNHEPTRSRNDSVTGASLDIDTQALLATPQLGFTNDDHPFNFDEVQQTGARGGITGETSQSFFGTSFPAPNLDLLSATSLGESAGSQIARTEPAPHPNIPWAGVIADENYRATALTNYSANPPHQSTFDRELLPSFREPIPAPPPFNFATGPTQGIEPRLPMAPTTHGPELPPKPAKRPRHGRGPVRDENERKQIEDTRKKGACIPCSLHRIKCVPDPVNPNGCCKTCSRKKILYMPCWRYKISDATLLDHADRPRPAWTTRWDKMVVADIQSWASDEIKTIKITQGVAGNTYKIKVRKFVPQREDKMARRWKTNGVEQSFECTPYGIADMQETGKMLIRFADDTLESSIDFYIPKEDPLMYRTYGMAYSHSRNAELEEEALLLKSALRLWCASRMESRSDFICGSETLGMVARSYEPKSVNDGKILVAPVYSAQMEIIVTALILKPAQRSVLKRLRKLMEGNKRRSLFAIYLCIFIILHSCALLTAIDNKKARKQGLDPERARFLRPSVVEELHIGAKTILAWFHNWNKGTRPFSQDWTSPSQMARSELTTSQCAFMRETAEHISEKSSHFRKIHVERSFEDDYFFIAQLYDPDWKPTHTI